ncbi:MAG: hypothetical protein ACKVOR_03110 [Flavobacteriales bacterium]
MRNINIILCKSGVVFGLSNEEGKTKISKSKLKEAGFNFKYHTYTYTAKAGAVYKFFYDYGYLPIENDFYIVVKSRKE